MLRRIYRARAELAVVHVRVPPRVHYLVWEDLRVELARLVADGARHMVLDFAEVVFADSFAISVLIDTRERLLRAGGSLGLSNVGPRIVRTLRLLRLDAIFAIRG